ncbi:MAG: hypothetical protein JWM86_143 [Thermoleophilia bacterium]|nr:hypothetical protein [Thermoleophilia bacterium]
MTAGATIDIERAPEHIRLEPDAAGDTAGTISHRAFVGWLLAGLLVLLAAIAAVNWYVDPTGVTGRQTRWLVVDNGEVRAEKLDLYDALETPPEVVLLGSSRTMKFEPSVVRELTGEAAFNASVSGGVPRDAWLFVRLLQERQGSRSEFPHLVWGLDVDAFREKQLRAGLSTDPRMSRFIPRSERAMQQVATVGTLTEMQTLKATWKSVRQGGAARPKATAAEPLERRFDATGFQLWSLPFPKQPIYLQRAVRKQIDQYAGFIFGRDSYVRVMRQPVADFADVVRIANRHGDVPTIFLTPYHPLAEEILAEHDIADRERDVKRTLRKLQRDGLRFRVVDLTELESFGGDPAQFYDGVHMTPANTRRVLGRLERDGLLARADTRR